MPGGQPDDHGIPEPGEISPEQRAEEAAYIAETVHPDHRASVAGVLSVLRGENPPSRSVQLCGCGRPDTPEHRAVWGDHRSWAPSVPVQLCGPDPDKGVLYIPAELLPDDPDTASEMLEDAIRSLSCPVHVVYRADWSPPVRPLPWPRRVLDRLVAPLARVLGF